MFKNVWKIQGNHVIHQHGCLSQYLEKMTYEIAVSEAENIIVGDPNEDTTIIGPVVSNIQFEKVQKLIQIGIDEGARLLQEVWESQMD